MLMRRIKRALRLRIIRLLGVVRTWKVKHKKNAYGLNRTEKRKQKIIVSMASYRPRYESIGLALKSLLMQSVKPDKIIVYLDEESEENKLTSEMLEYAQYGIEYQFTYDGLRPHKKYFYAMQEYSNDLVITVDDDIIYPRGTIASLIRKHQKHPNAVCARRVHQIKMKDKKVVSYCEWNFEYRSERMPSYLLCATGAAGCLYPPNVLPQKAFDQEQIKELCLNADDLWLKIMELLNHVKVVWVPHFFIMPNTTEGSQEVALCIENLKNGGNDEYLDELAKVYPEAFELLEKASR